MENYFGAIARTFLRTGCRSSRLPVSTAPCACNKENYEEIKVTISNRSSVIDQAEVHNILLVIFFFANVKSQNLNPLEVSNIIQSFIFNFCLKFLQNTSS